MSKKPVIILAEDDPGHAGLIMKSLKREGFTGDIFHFEDGAETLNFLFKKGPGPHRENGVPYILLLDIRMPLVDGIEVLKQIRQDEELSRMPVIMVTTTEDPAEMRKCRELGCSHYFVKPVSSEMFSQTMKRLSQCIHEAGRSGISHQ